MLSACERSQWDPTLKIGEPKGHLVDKQDRRRATGSRTYAAADRGIGLGSDSGAAPKDSVKLGTGTFVHKVTPPSVDTTPGDITLNFDGTDIREVVKVILGDLLGVNYVLEPGVQGVASLQTGRPLRREDLIPTLETLLRMNNAALVNRGGSYEVVTLTNAIQGKVVPQLGESSQALPAGYSVQVVPLRYIGADEMSNILQPLAPQGSIIRVDNLRNMLVLAGSSPDIGNLLDTIRVFDVDWMSGLSVGFFTLDYATASDVVTQLESLLADEGGNPFKGLFRFVPVDSANSILVVSPQEKYLEQAKDWIDRLDLAEASGEGAQRLFVYRVKHGDAENLADILTQLFSSGGGGSRPVGGVAPGLRQASVESSPSGRDGRDGRDGGNATSQRQAARPAVASQIEISSSVSIVADSINNSLLIKSNPRDYKKILDALKQLDLVPLQVLVEATIVEISLSGQLRYGVQWQFQGGGPSGYDFNYSLDNTLDGDSESGIGPAFPGFNWTAVLRPDTVRAVLSALASEGLVNVLSSPSLMVLDNQTAKIQVGKEVPVATSQQQGTATTDRIVNQIEYRDTGVQLSVKPRVTPGGLVQMEIEQEVSTVSETDSSALNSPTFQTRKISSNVAVRSNQAVVLGGLIEDEREDTNQGIPGLYSLPVIGPLFGERRRTADRRELIVVLTPRVITSDADIQAVTEDFRGKLKGLEYRF
ncbi:MAG: type II secretion system secretin GspD [Chromatiaceae bacterium]|nr:type II secretion system secretin GspD [Chromatiaceae bacterium]